MARTAATVGELARVRRVLQEYRREHETQARRRRRSHAFAEEAMVGEDDLKRSKATTLERVEGVTRATDDALMRVELHALATKYFAGKEWEEAVRAVDPAKTVLHVDLEQHARGERSSVACLRSPSVSVGEAARLLATVFASVSIRHSRWTLLSDTLGGAMTTLMAAHPPPSPFAPLLARYGPSSIGFILALAALEAISRERETSNPASREQIRRLARMASDSLLSCMSPSSWTLALGGGDEERGELDDEKKGNRTKKKLGVLVLLANLALYPSAMEFWRRETDISSVEARRLILGIMLTLGRIPSALDLVRRAHDLAEKRALMGDLWEGLGAGEEEARRRAVRMLSTSECALLEEVLASSARLRPQTVAARAVRLDTLVRLNLLIGRHEAGRMRANELEGLLANARPAEVGAAEQARFLGAVVTFAESHADTLSLGGRWSGDERCGEEECPDYAEVDARSAREAVRREMQSFGERRRVVAQSSSGGGGLMAGIEEREEDEEARTARYRELLEKQRGRLGETEMTTMGEIASFPSSSLASPFLSPIPVPRNVEEATTSSISTPAVAVSRMNVETQPLPRAPSLTVHPVEPPPPPPQQQRQQKSKTQLLKEKLSKMASSKNDR